jgi:hypothetical protein
MTTSYTASTAALLSADIAAVDAASKTDGGNGTAYSITLQADTTLTESADIAAINLAGKDTLTLNGQSAVLNGDNLFRGLFAHSGITTIGGTGFEKTLPASELPSGESGVDEVRRKRTRSKAAARLSALGSFQSRSCEIIVGTTAD